MRNRMAPIASLALLMGSMSGLSGAETCKTVSGIMQETIIPSTQAPNDPFGRIVGLFNGDFGGVSIAALTAFLVTPATFSPVQSGPSSVMQVRHAFMTGPGDTVITLGKTIFTPGPATQPGQFNFVNSVCPFAPCVVENPQELEIIGGTGRWANATGVLRNLGIGNLDLPNGQGTFVFVVKGEVCVPRP